MSTYTLNLYHVVFGTKGRVPSLAPSGHKAFFSYVWGICKNADSYLVRINAMQDHVHILVDLHPTRSVASFVKTVKQSSHAWIDNTGVFPLFESWQSGYGAFTADASAKPRLIEYIRTQPNHHKQLGFAEELKQIVEAAGLPWDERYLP